jgi:hypothetical protein
MLEVAKLMDARSLSFDGGLQELATLFHRIALMQFAPEALLDDAERERLAPYARPSMPSTCSSPTRSPSTAATNCRWRPTTMPASS